MAALIQSLFCALIFTMIGIQYRPFPGSRYNVKVSLIAWAACSITGMQFMSLMGRIVLTGMIPDVSWFNTAFYGLVVILVYRADGNVARIWRVE